MLTDASLVLRMILHPDNKVMATNLSISHRRGITTVELIYLRLRGEMVAMTIIFPMVHEKPRLLIHDLHIIATSYGGSSPLTTESLKTKCLIEDILRLRSVCHEERSVSMTCRLLTLLGLETVPRPAA
jgi:hypothetical protein